LKVKKNDRGPDLGDLIAGYSHGCSISSLNAADFQRIRRPVFLKALQIPFTFGNAFSY